jgi:hypothetical protein
MTSIGHVDLPVGLDAVPALLHEAVARVPRATVIEIRDDGAVLGARTSTALGARNTVLGFTRVSATASRVDVLSSGAMGFTPRRPWYGSPQQTPSIVPLEVTEVLAALRSLAEAAPPGR